jgi:hypothetical protein
MLGTTTRQFLILPFRHLESEKRVAMVEGFARQWVGGECDHWDSINDWIPTLGIKGIGRELKAAIKRLQK